jgi:hypothetical protein
MDFVQKLNSYNSPVVSASRNGFGILSFADMFGFSWNTLDTANMRKEHLNFTHFIVDWKLLVNELFLWSDLDD